MVEAEINELVHDSINKIITAPAYMKGTATPSEIYSNVKLMVNEVAQQLREAEVAPLPFTVIVHVEIKKEKLKDFKKAIKFNAEQSRLENGCFRFDVLED